MRNIVFFLLISLIIFSGLVMGEVGTGANFLKIGVGPRQIGLGSAFTGVADDIYSIYWNPAGLGFIRNWEFSLMADRYFADIYLGSVAGAKQFRFLGSRKFTLGGGIFHLGMPDWDSMEDRVAQNQPFGSASNTMYTLSVAQRLDWLPIPELQKQLSIGMNIKYLQSKLLDEDASGLAYDIGLSYNRELWERPFSVGLAMQNMGDSLKYIQQGSPLPLGFRGGVSYLFGACTSHQFLLASDISKYRGSDVKLGFGTEYWFKNRIALRGGYLINGDDLGDISFGLSYRFGLLQSGTRIDGAYQDYNSLNNTLSGAYTLYATGPEPFRLVYPEDEQPFCINTPIPFEWENAPGSSKCDQIRYRLLADTSLFNIKKAVNKLKINPLDSTNTIISIATSELIQELVLPIVRDTIYYWTTVAIDQEQKVRQADQIWKVILHKPDIIIEQIALVTEDIKRNFLYGIHDPVKSGLEVILRNTGHCDAVNFSVILTDSLLCPLDYRQFKHNFEQIIDRLFVDSLLANSVDTLYCKWNIKKDGLHKVYGEADYRLEVIESNENNNSSHMFATTGAKGLVEIDGVKTPPRDEIYDYQRRISGAEPPEVRLIKVLSENCDIPLVPFVFFEHQSSNVADDYFEEASGEPFPLLQEIGTRMNDQKDTKLILKGYIDYDTENRTTQENLKLASARAQAVKQILVHNWKLPSERIEIQIDSDSVSKKRIQPHSTISEIRPIDLTMISEENRRVELVPDNLSPAAEALFRPKKNLIRPYFQFPIKFVSEIQTPDGCSGWQLEIVKEPKKTPVITLPFQIDNSRSDVTDTLYWYGYDKIGNLVELHQDYSFRLNLANKAGEWNSSLWKTFRIVADSSINNRLVHLMQFDQHVPVYAFSNDSIRTAAEKFVNEINAEIQNNENSTFSIDTVSCYILGFTCVIGREERLMELANNQRTEAILTQFKSAIKSVLIERNQALSDTSVIFPRIDINAHKNARKYIPKVTVKQWYKEPLAVPQACCDREVIYGTETPVGRNYNRRVEIVLSRKIQDFKSKPRIITDK
ncbi:PorV/PorQ family protein [candidate division KSB1 bacterium]|nr:PorV/PorQ family protein [candidate division KSB1 bacterium]